MEINTDNRLDRKLDPLRIYMLIRRDLNMNAGKIAAQASHAALDVYIKCAAAQPTLAETYRNGYQGIKICLSVPDLEHMLQAEKLATEAGLFTALIYDLGYTCFEGKTTVTALGIGPARKSEIEHITGKYQLYK